MIKNAYGNFVVQKALKLAVGRDKQNLINAIQKVLHLIQDKKIRNKWEQIITDAASDLGDDSQVPRQITAAKRTNSNDSS